MNFDGTGRTKVADDVREVCWSPDGTALALLKAEFPNRYVHEDYASKGLAVYDVATDRTREDCGSCAAGRGTRRSNAVVRLPVPRKAPGSKTPAS
jgi:hypothetical protein